jgi:hypothetical protein
MQLILVTKSQIISDGGISTMGKIIHLDFR